MSMAYMSSNFATTLDETINSMKMKPAKIIRRDIDSLPPVEYRHLMLDLANICISGVGSFLPMVMWPHIEYLKNDYYAMAAAILLYTSVHYWVCSGFFMFIEALGLTWDMYTIDPATRIKFQDGAPVVLRNQIVNGVILALFLIAGWSFRPSDLDKVPNVFEYLKWMWIVGMMIGEIVFYCTHRLLHTPQFFYWHKMHHEMNHVSLTVAWGARYCSLLEDLLSNMGSICSGCFFVSLHPLFFLFWVTHAQWNVITNHTGYHEKYLPVSAALAGMVHHNHHANGKADFGGTPGWMDWVCKTKGANHPGSVFAGFLDYIWTSFGGDTRL